MINNIKANNNADIWPKNCKKMTKNWTCNKMIHAIFDQIKKKYKATYNTKKTMKNAFNGPKNII